MEKLERLKEKITQKGNLLVAFSGGIDSGLLLKVARDAWGRGFGSNDRQRTVPKTRIGRSRALFKRHRHPS